jgi:hypothetical protein
VPETLSNNQTEDDVHKAWVYAINADLGPNIENIDDPNASERALVCRRQRYARYAKYLLHDLAADAARLAQVAETCRSAKLSGWPRATPMSGTQSQPSSSISP